MLRVSNVHHNKAGLTEQPDWYRITDHLEFSLDIHEFCEGSWTPYRWAQGSATQQSSRLATSFTEHTELSRLLQQLQLLLNAQTGVAVVPALPKLGMLVITGKHLDKYVSVMLQHS